MKEGERREGARRGRCICLGSVTEISVITKRKRKEKELWLSALAKNRLCGGSFTQAVELFGGLLKGKILGHQSQLRA